MQDLRSSSFCNTGSFGHAEAGRRPAGQSGRETRGRRMVSITQVRSPPGSPRHRASYAGHTSPRRPSAFDVLQKLTRRESAPPEPLAAAAPAVSSQSPQSPGGNISPFHVPSEPPPPVPPVVASGRRRSNSPFSTNAVLDHVQEVRRRQSEALIEPLTDSELTQLAHTEYAAGDDQAGAGVVILREQINAAGVTWEQQLKRLAQKESKVLEEMRQWRDNIPGAREVELLRRLAELRLESADTVRRREAELLGFAEARIKGLADRCDMQRREMMRLRSEIVNLHAAPALPSAVGCTAEQEAELNMVVDTDAERVFDAVRAATHSPSAIPVSTPEIGAPLQGPPSALSILDKDAAVMQRRSFLPEDADVRRHLATKRLVVALDRELRVQANRIRELNEVFKKVSPVLCAVHSALSSVRSACTGVRVSVAGTFATLTEELRLLGVQICAALPEPVTPPARRLTPPSLPSDLLQAVEDVAAAAVSAALAARCVPPVPDQPPVGALHGTLTAKLQAARHAVRGVEQALKDGAPVRRLSNPQQRPPSPPSLQQATEPSRPSPTRSRPPRSAPPTRPSSGGSRRPHSAGNRSAKSGTASRSSSRASAANSPSSRSDLSAAGSSLMPQQSPNAAQLAVQRQQAAARRAQYEGTGVILSEQHSPSVTAAVLPPSLAEAAGAASEAAGAAPEAADAVPPPAPPAAAAPPAEPDPAPPPPLAAPRPQQKVSSVQLAPPEEDAIVRRRSAPAGLGSGTRATGTARRNLSLVPQASAAAQAAAAGALRPAPPAAPAPGAADPASQSQPPAEVAEGDAPQSPSPAVSPGASAEVPPSPPAAPRAPAEAEAPAPGTAAASGGESPQVQPNMVMSSLHTSDASAAAVLPPVPSAGPRQPSPPRHSPQRGSTVPTHWNWTLVPVPGMFGSSGSETAAAVTAAGEAERASALPEGASWTVVPVRQQQLHSPPRVRAAPPTGYTTMSWGQAVPTGMPRWPALPARPLPIPPPAAAGCAPPLYQLAEWIAAWGGLCVVPSFAIPTAPVGRCGGAGPPATARSSDAVRRERTSSGAQGCVLELRPEGEHGAGLRPTGDRLPPRPPMSRSPLQGSALLPPSHQQSAPPSPLRLGNSAPSEKRGRSVTGTASEQGQQEKLPGRLHKGACSARPRPPAATAFGSCAPAAPRPGTASLRSRPRWGAEGCRFAAEGSVPYPPPPETEPIGGTYDARLAAQKEVAAFRSDAVAAARRSGPRVLRELVPA
eukprot:TRINITY_DN472_c0_g1_i1.p1 TRINITY_DN472_c0_g1~~TRINITY_DN472_c0_g1_i1.p1  ORF type:complete len:1272 (+),score=176.85 TRINITY_DN472_c0_g1_i1:93-3818(+)